jgi:hypothetical protein
MRAAARTITRMVGPDPGIDLPIVEPRCFWTVCNLGHG